MKRVEGNSESRRWGAKWGKGGRCGVKARSGEKEKEVEGEEGKKFWERDGERCGGGRSFRKQMEKEVEGEEGVEVEGKRWRQRWRAKRGKKF